VIILEQRVRLFLGSIELQVAQLHPTTGVPALEPAPNMVSCIDHLLIAYSGMLE
jgi:hypothetical protein